MTPPSESSPVSERGLSLLLAVLFALAHTQPWHFYSNQNQYYLHGLAHAGHGDLGHDWLANTADPTPLFSLLVYVCHATVGVAALQLVFFALLVTYFLSLWYLAKALPFAPRSWAGLLAMGVGVVLLHSGILRAGSVAAFGVDYVWYFQAGVAHQYILGAGLQPSVFGVFLVSAIAAFVQQRNVLAGLYVGFACTMHSTYLLPAGLLVLGMGIELAWRRKQRREAVKLGTVSLACVLPVVLFNAMTFAPANTTDFHEAQRILAWVRIPHHTDFRRWFDVVAGLQLLGLLLGLLLFQRTSLWIAVVLAVVFTGIQLTGGSATLALLFPWRLSAVLVPVSTLALLAGLMFLLERFVPLRVLVCISILGVVLALVGMGVVYQQNLAYQETAAETELLQQLVLQRQPGEVYLLPTGFPPPPSRRGSAASTFVPIKTSATASIFELQRFRLGTGACVYVDFKSIPYKADEVLEWNRRMNNAVRWYALEEWTPQTLQEMRDDGISHVVLPANAKVRMSAAKTVLQTSAYRVVQIADAKP